MIELLVIAFIIILSIPLVRARRFKEIERQQAMRRAMLKLRDKYQNYSF